MRRPRVLTKCVADRFSEKSKERIVEFSDANGAGGLISFYMQTDGKLRVCLYRLDDTVVVMLDKKHLMARGEP